MNQTFIHTTVIFSYKWFSFDFDFYCTGYIFFIVKQYGKKAEVKKIFERSGTGRDDINYIEQLNYNYLLKTVN